MTARLRLLLVVGLGAATVLVPAGQESSLVSRATPAAPLSGCDARGPLRVSYHPSFRGGEGAGFTTQRATVSNIAEGCRGARLVATLTTRAPSGALVELGQSAATMITAGATGETASVLLWFPSAPSASDVDRVDLRLLPPTCDAEEPDALRASPQTAQTGTAGDDVLDGGVGNDRLSGLSGADCLRGHPGNDRLSGGAGDDTVLGGDDNDQLRGDGGVDIISGGTGNDVIWGGDGDDALFAGTGGGTLDGGPGRDTCVRTGGQVSYKDCEVVVG